MARLSRKEIVTATGAIDTGGNGGESFDRFSIDSRSIRKGDLFIAIIGPHHDGHKFVEEAARNGASGILASRPPSPPVPDRLPVFEVADTHQALQDLAAFVRRREHLKVIGITGSAGKTTTKEMAFHVVSSATPSYRSPGNLNNLYGLPLALLRMPEGTETAVLEMGMSSKGELLRLARIAGLDVGCLTNILPVHLEFFDSVEEIAAAKAEIFEEPTPASTAVWNRDDPLVESICRDLACHSVSFGLRPGADWSAGAIKEQGLEGISFDLLSPDGSEPVHLRAPGRHNLENALAAAAIGGACGISLERIAAALERFRPLQMRGACMTLPSGVRIIDDCYNSNPAAMERVLDWFSGLETGGRRIMVSGDMLELGSGEEENAHRRLGKQVARSKTDMFIGVGPLHAHSVEAARGAGLHQSFHFATAEEAGEYLAGQVHPDDLLLIKGSRGIRMEQVIRKLDSRERCGG